MFKGITIISDYMAGSEIYTFSMIIEVLHELKQYINFRTTNPECNQQQDMEEAWQKGVEMCGLFPLVSWYEKVYRSTM